MNIRVFGAGAVGSHAAARLAAAKTETIPAVARGAHLKAIREPRYRLRKPSICRAVASLALGA